MNSKTIVHIGSAIFGVIIGIYAISSIVLNPTGGIAGISILIAIFGIIIGLASPAKALVFLAIQAIYADELKRVGVYYGVQSTQTISQILIGPLLTLCAINVSFLYGLLRRKYRLSKLGYAIYMVAPIIALVMAINGRNSGWGLSLYLAGTTSLYMTLVPICTGLFKSQEEWAGFISFQVAIAAPAAVWGIWQYYNGFNAMELSYANSGLSRVHSLQMRAPDPRIFGLFGSASAFGCVGLYAAFAAWHTIRYRKQRILFVLLSATYLFAAVLSQQRTTLLYPFIILVFAYAFRRKITTFAFYGIMVVVFVVGAINADYLMNEGLQKINDTIQTDGKWGKNVLNVGTFSDRLKGWDRLTRKESWSMFGTGKLLSSNANNVERDFTSQDFNHDIINKILIYCGAFGLIVVVIVGIFIMTSLHSVTFRCRGWQQRKDSAFVLACIFPLFILSFLAGDNFTTTPINLQIWSIFAGVMIMRKIGSSETIPSVSNNFLRDTNLNFK